jgi:hypothetical protein
MLSELHQSAAERHQRADLDQNPKGIQPYNHSACEHDGEQQ